MINDLVDAGNLAAARSLVPIGLYDIGKMDGEPKIEISNGGELFRGIGGKDEDLKQVIPVLTDDSGVMHLYPHRDSMRTRITSDTTDVLVIGCGAKGIRRNTMRTALEYLKHYFSELGV